MYNNDIGEKGRRVRAHRDRYTHVEVVTLDFLMNIGSLGLADKTASRLSSGWRRGGGGCPYKLYKRLTSKMIANVSIDNSPRTY